MSRRILPTRVAGGGTRYEERFTYDHVGNKLSETDANGHETLFAYDPLNRLVGRVDAEGNEVVFVYDEAGNQILEHDVTRGLSTTST